MGSSGDEAREDVAVAIDSQKVVRGGGLTKRTNRHENTKKRKTSNNRSEEVIVDRGSEIGDDDELATESGLLDGETDIEHVESSDKTPKLRRKYEKRKKFFNSNLNCPSKNRRIEYLIIIKLNFKYHNM